jgi:hypothetical protein
MPQRLKSSTPCAKRRGKAEAARVMTTATRVRTEVARVEAERGERRGRDQYHPEHREVKIKKEHHIQCGSEH